MNDDKNSKKENGNSRNYDNMIMARTVGLTPIKDSVGFRVFFTEKFKNILDEIALYTKSKTGELNEQTLNRAVSDFVAYWQSSSKVFTTKTNFIKTFVEVLRISKS